MQNYIFIYILTVVLLDSCEGGKIFWTEWEQAFLEFNLHLTPRLIWLPMYKKRRNIRIGATLVTKDFFVLFLKIAGDRSGQLLI
jgi:hypothetical protein